MPWRLSAAMAMAGRSVWRRWHRGRELDEISRADFAQACDLLSQAIELSQFGGLHIMYKERSAARLAMGDVDEAFTDAKEALTIAPRYPQAYICKGDIYMSTDQFDKAEESYSIALDLETSIRHSKSFKARIAKLQEKLTPANLG